MTQEMSDHQRMGKNVAKRRAQIREQNEVGDLLTGAHEAERIESERSLYDWGIRYFLGSWLQYEPSVELRKMVYEDERAVVTGCAIHCVVPRGSGKTTWQKIAALWALLTGRRHWVVVIGATEDHASAFLADCTDALTGGNALLSEDYPALCQIMTEARMSPLRRKRMTHRGQPLNVDLAASLLALPGIDSQPWASARMSAVGWTGSVRGLLHNGQRPDFAFVDDIQTRKSAKNPAVVAEQVRWLQGDVRGLSGQRKRMTVAIASTPICAGDLCERLQRRGDFPDIETTLLRAVIKWPCPDGWAKWSELRRADLIDGGNRAREYYDAERSTLEADGELLDPLSVRDGEPSAWWTVHARKMELGEEAFEAEYQMTVKRSECCVLLDVSSVAARADGSALWRAAAESSGAVVGIDVMSIEGLRWTLAVGAPGGRAHIAAYGRWPDNRTRIYQAGATQEERDIAIAGRITELARMLRSAHVITADGRKLAIVAGYIDRGWAPRAVEAVAARTAEGRGWLVPCVGRSAARFSERGRNRVETRGKVLAWGDGSYLSAGDPPFVVYDADACKEAVQRGFAVTPGSIGAISIHGQPWQHVDFATEICAERLMEKTFRMGAGNVYSWEKIGDNHYLDSTALALLGLSWSRLSHRPQQRIQLVR